MITSPRKVFVSYSHRQGDWVWDRLVPVLKASGVEVLIDRERFEAGRGLTGQMDATQDMAEVSVLVLSPEYLASRPCLHEMGRAIDRDPRFENGVVVPVMRVDVELPQTIRQPIPIYADLTDDSAVQPWDLLLRACGADLRTDAPKWLTARDEMRRFLERGQSVNLVVDSAVAWRGLLAELQRGELADLALVNLEKPTTVSRRG
ncbi:MAG TPA: toll/interleukin-1 receptor domain-containing protein [Thermoanaerobaculia bacterium]|nr:toll/interleukin-1 receptor domain-containing protein [Thermoanaerobaculia bacterium]